MKALEKINCFDESKIEKLLVPVWESQEIVDETGLVIGEDGKVNLLALPIKQSVVVKNIFQDVMYEEGIDYVVDGKTIKRIKGGNLPFFAVDEYFRKKPHEQIILKVDKTKSDFKFEEDRYIYFSEGVDGFDKYISISYKTDEKPTYGLINKDDRLDSFVENLKNSKRAKVKFYGDSITVGCNATGTKYGGNVSPFTPSWITLVQRYLEMKFCAKIDVENHAVGGWRSVEGIDNFEQKCGKDLDKTDLFCIGFGANDILSGLELFRNNVCAMIDGYFKANPNGMVLLYSSLLPNSQAKGWRTDHAAFEKVLEDISLEYKNVGVAKVSTVYSHMEKLGKFTRDLLANSINHPNDFGVRLYAQTIIKTLLG